MTGTATAAPRGERVHDSAGPGLPRLVRIELRKSADTRAGAWLLAVIGAAALAVVVLQVLYEEPEKRTLADYLAGSQLGVGVLLPVLGILLVTSEWSQRTATTTFCLVPRRSRVLAAKVLAATVLAVVSVAATALAAVAGALLTPVLTDGDTDWTLPGALVAQVLVVQVASVLVGVAFGMVLLSSPVAIVLYFVLPTAVTVLVSAVGALDWVREWLDLTTTSTPMYEGGLDAGGWARFGTSLLLWLLLPLGAGWLRVLRREIV